MPNRLQHESSPYLLQHANNPVDWYPWGDEALEKAKRENKLLLISIGYAACHWCHVMEHECFEDEEVAQLMNTHFVNIKVDREERPDVDKVYMDAVMVMTQRGGWPLNAIALPDGRPIYGGTYYPKPNWMDALTQLTNLYKNEPSKAEAYGRDLQRAINDMGRIVPVKEPLAFNLEDVSQLSEKWTEQLDYKFGGRKVANNKFPLPVNNQFLLRAAWFLQQHKVKIGEAVQAAVDITLHKMAFGGIYDHLGGGFARYSVDAYWKVPHFEKMLYDNGQMVSLYAEAYQATDDPAKKDLYKHVVDQCLSFIENELTSPEGGFYSSLDADSEGEEGKFYVWSFEEIESLLGEDAKLFADYYNVHPFGNWEGKNVLFVLETEAEFATRWKLDIADFWAKMEAGRKTLFDARAKRIRPGLDDKILTSWNAMMLKGYVDAYKILGTKKYLDIAVKNASFIQENLSEAGRLWRNYKNGQRSIDAFLDDYAHVIDAYISLYQVTFEDRWLSYALEHLEYVQSHFGPAENGLFYYTSDTDDPLVKRSIEAQDDVIPASNSVLAAAMFQLSLLYGKSEWQTQAKMMLATMKKAVMDSPAWHARWAQLGLNMAFPHYEIAITGTGSLEKRMAFSDMYFPNKIFAGTENGSDLPLLEGRQGESLTFYVCQDFACRLPVYTMDEAKALLVGT